MDKGKKVITRQFSSVIVLFVCIISDVIHYIELKDMEVHFPIVTVVVNLVLALSSGLMEFSV